MDTVAETTALGAYARRVAGTDAERRAALHLRGRLEAMGRDAELQPLRIAPRFAAALALYAAVAVVGSVVATGNAAVGTAFVAIATALAALDLTGRLRWPRRLTGTRASQNVESREPGDKPGVVVLVAGYDQPREGRLLALATRAVRNPWLAVVGSMGLILACCLVRLSGAEGTVLAAIQFLPTLVLVIAFGVLADYELSGPGVDPARDAAVATALRLVEDLGGRLTHFRLWVVFTGAQRPFALGMTEWLKRRRKELDSESTAVIALGRIGPGAVRFTRREGPIVPLRVHSRLLRVCEEIAQDEGGQTGARSVHEPSDAAAAIARGLPAVTVSSEDDGAGDRADGSERAFGFCRELIRRLDAEVGPQLAEAEGRPAATSA